MEISRSQIPDGSRTVIKTDGSVVSIDAGGTVTAVQYANGNGFQLAYDTGGRVTSVTSLQTGQTISVGEQTSISVDALGVVTVIRTGEPPSAQILRTDGSATVLTCKEMSRQLALQTAPVHSNLHMTTTGAMSQMMLPDGAVLTRSAPGQPWMDVAGQPAASDVHITEAGTLVVTYVDGHVNSYHPDGSVENGAADTAVSELLSEEALDSAAQDIRGALNFESALGHFGDVDSDRIIDILSSMSEADRRNLEAQYFEQYGISLRDELQWRLNPETYAQAIAVLDRQDGEANDLGQVEIAFTHLNSDPSRGQTDLINTFSVLNSQQIQELDAQYMAAHGHSLRDAIMNDSRIDAATKQALLLLLNGTDQNLDAEGNWQPQVFTQLSDLSSCSPVI